MYIFKKYFTYIPAFALMFWLVSGCALDITNPNQATEAEVLNSADGIRNLTIGMQGIYSNAALPAFVLNPAVTTREMAINTTFASLIELEDGGVALPAANSRINSIWDNLLRVIDMSDKILNNAPDLIVDDGELSGIMALAGIYKAMSLGYLLQSFEQTPLGTGENVDFAARGDALAEAISLLEDALQRINTTAPSNNFNNNILLSGFDMVNTIHAYRARYHLMAGNYQEAIDAANAVDPTATSVFSYDGATSRNPIFEGVLSGDEGQEYAARDNFGTPVTEAGDERIDFYLNSEDETSTPNGLPIDELSGFFATATTPIPVYLPGEMNLIRAEAYVNLDQPGNAVSEIDAIRTKQGQDDPFGLGANLPAYTGPTDDQSLFTEIYRQRSAELYLTGLRFDDMRRLGRPMPSNDPPLTAERNRVFYPYPEQERQNNPNTPEDPPI